MPGRIIITLSVFLGLGACATAWNPLNWFGGSRAETIALTPEDGYADTSETRTIVSQVTEMSIVRSSGGAIIHATGLPPRHGYWGAELVPENNELPVNGVLTYVFRIHEPTGANANRGTGASAYARQVIVAHFVSENTLQGVRQIRILGTENSRVARR